jgi:AraC family transcriptional activator FtrA
MLRRSAGGLDAWRISSIRTRRLELLREAGTIAIPGWRMSRHEVPDALLIALREAHRNGSRIVSICGGAYVLAAAGLLSGRRATTHWHHATDFASRFHDVGLEPDVLYVDEGDVLTSAGCAAGLDLCLHIVRRDHGPAVANGMARSLVTPPHRSGGQAQYVRHPLPTGPANRLSPLLDWMRGSLSRTLSIAQLSERVAMSPRTFCRHFGDATGLTPGAWLLQERLSLARELLETTRLGIDEVAFRSGFGSSATPSEHRSSFAHD